MSNFYTVTKQKDADYGYADHSPVYTIVDQSYADYPPVYTIVDQSYAHNLPSIQCRMKADTLLFSFLLTCFPMVVAQIKRTTCVARQKTQRDISLHETARSSLIVSLVTHLFLQNELQNATKEERNY